MELLLSRGYPAKCKGLPTKPTYEYLSHILWANFACILPSNISENIYGSFAFSDKTRCKFEYVQ